MSDQPRHFVVGDTHGHFELVEKLINSNIFDAENDFVYFLGDYYPHNGKDGDVNKLMDVLNRYYNPDITKPGFHLLRGNNEWKWSRFNDVFGDIMIADCPDLVVLKIKEITFCLSHCGMHKDLWDKIKASENTEYHLNVGEKDVLYRAIVNERKYDIECTFSDNSSTEPADYWPKNTDNTWFIHGHLPAHKDNEVQGYNYKPLNPKFEHDNSPNGFVRVNTLRHALNIDAGKGFDGDKECYCLACICLEDYAAYLTDNTTPFAYVLSNTGENNG